MYKNLLKNTIPFLLFLIAALNLSQPGSPILADMESPSYRIEGETIGPSGQTESSFNYSLLETIGDFFARIARSVTYQLRGGFNPSIEANVPGTPTFSNPASYYNKLKFVVDSANNPSDCEFAIATTDDSWTTTEYIQADGTVGASIVWQTYANWGGASGELVTGLLPDTTHKIKVKARCGSFTETGWGPEASAATVSPSIAVDISGLSVDFGELDFINIATASPSTILTITTNAESGYLIRIKDEGDGSSPGLYSLTAAKLITSQTATLLVGTEGYGIQGASATATIAAIYNKTGDDVGGFSQSFQDLASNSGPVTSETVTVTAKAAAAKATTAADDYSDTLTFIVTVAY